MSSDIIDEFIARARAITVAEAAVLCGFRVGAREHSGPCPACGGRDRFSINARKQVFNCRGCNAAGGDGIGLMALVRGLDLGARAGFLEACAAALGEPVPDGGERLTDAEHAASAARIEARRAESARAALASDERQAEFRRREVEKARGIYFGATDAGDDVLGYLFLRTGFDLPDGIFDNIRFIPMHALWHGADAFGRPREVHCGPAMIAPFVAPDGTVTGCHETWLDLGCGPRYRPQIADGEGGIVPSKKMRGTKRGSVIPVLGGLGARRWVLAEGIENVAAWAGLEGFRDDTFYGATGDIGNMAGPADPRSAFPHPELKTAKGRPQRVPGPVPKVDQQPGDAAQVPEHVAELLLIADGDSEHYFTMAAMARAEARLARAGRVVGVCWPPADADFSDISASYRRMALDDDNGGWGGFAADHAGRISP